MALRVGLENVEKRIAIAVTTMSFRKARPIGTKSSEVRRASIAEARRRRPAPMMATLTASVRAGPEPGRTRAADRLRMMAYRVAARSPCGRAPPL
jgi:hypothetical protein